MMTGKKVLDKQSPITRQADLGGDRDSCITVCVINQKEIEVNY